MATRKTLRAKFSSTCPACGVRIEAGKPITRLDKGWGHPACASRSKRKKKSASYSTRSAVREARRQIALINAGETFRSQRPSDWRRKSRPNRIG